MHDQHHISQPMCNNICFSQNPVWVHGYTSEYIHIGQPSSCYMTLPKKNIPAIFNAWCLQMSKWIPANIYNKFRITVLAYTEGMLKIWHHSTVLYAQSFLYVFMHDAHRCACACLQIICIQPRDLVYLGWKFNEHFIGQKLHACVNLHVQK